MIIGSLIVIFKEAEVFPLWK